MSFRTSKPFAACFALAMGRFRSLWWLVDSPGDPFAPGHDAAAIARLHGARYDHPPLAAAGCSLWRPGTFPDLAPWLVEDDWLYLIGLPGPESAAVAAAERIVADRRLSESFFTSIDAEQATLLLERHEGEWDVYSPLVLALDGTLGEPEIVDSARRFAAERAAR